MLVNKGDQEGLFRGAIMQSGGPIPVGDIEHGQLYYDILVRNAACDKSPDTLECLRSVPYARLKYAIDASPDFFAYEVKQVMIVSGRGLTVFVGTCACLASSCRWCILD
jgi:acetylcholinesterase